jgi:CHAT domain-containing protein
MLSISKICPRCGQTREVELRQVFDLEAEPELRQRFLRGEINVLRCPGCGVQSVVPGAMVFKDPINKRVIFFIPDIPQITEGLFHQMLTQLSNRLAEITPPDPPDYLSNPVLCRDPIELTKLLAIPKTIPKKDTIPCPQCQEPSEVMVCQLFDYEQAPDLVQRLVQLEINFFECPECATPSLVSIPVAVHDPAQEQLVLFIPNEPDQDDQKVRQIILRLEQDIAETLTGHLPEYLLNPVVVRDPVKFFRYLKRVVIKMSGDEVVGDLNGMDELRSLIISAMTPEQKSLFLTLLANAQDEESFNQELNEHPELMAAIEQARSNILHTSRILEISEAIPNFLPILTEIAQLTQRADMPRRLDLCYRALEMIDHDKEPEIWAEIQYTLGNTLAQNPQGSRIENLELAIKAYENALTVRTQDFLPIEWAGTQLGLSNVYSMRIKEEHADNVEKAIYHCEQALQVFTKQTSAEEWAMASSNLANMYRNRVKGRPRDNIESAIFYYEQSLEVFDQENSPKDWAHIQHHLALAYMARTKGAKTKNIARAIHHCQQALEVRKKETMPFEWAMTQTNLAEAYSLSRDIERSIFHYNEALRVFNQKEFPEQRAVTQNKLAIAYFTRVEGKHVENIKQGVYHSQQALQEFTLQAFPADYRQVQRNLGNLYFMEGQWAEAEAAYQNALRAGQNLLDVAYTETGRQAEVRETAQLYAHTAYGQLKLGQYDVALTTVDSGKTRLLSQALALDESNLAQLHTEQQEAVRQNRTMVRELEAEMRLLPSTPARRDDRVLAEALRGARAQLNELIKSIQQDHPDFIPTGLDLPELLALIPTGGALVAPLVTSQGGAVFVVPSGVTTVGDEHILWLDEVTADTVRGWFIGTPEEPGWLREYENYTTKKSEAATILQEIKVGVRPSNERQHAIEIIERADENWQTAISRMTAILWKKLVAPIYQHLETFGLAPQAEILLMPQGGLGLLPLHAAWREVEGTKRAFLDDYTVTYAPSGYALRVSQRRLMEPQRHQRSLLAVVNPTQDLTYTAVEGEAITALFPPAQVTLLAEAQATPEAVISAVGSRQSAVNILHFSCHGFYNWQEVMRSGLVLAGSQPLTLAHIIANLDLNATRLVTLSACETGLTEFQQTPDEYIGLPAGFLQAGAPGVISTLWAVDDLSTMLLMERFYTLHLQDGLGIAKTLRQAQLWLRDVTAGELRERFSEERQMLMGGPRMPAEVVRQEYRRFAKMNPDERPFAHPYYWAAFTFSGA